MKDLLAKVKVYLTELQKQPFYPERKVIRGAVAGLAAAVVAAVGLSASPLVAGLVAPAVAAVVSYLAKPAEPDLLRRVTIRRKAAEKAARTR
jgi:hypothetical protein